MQVHLHGLATALPPNVLPQDVVLRNAREILGPRYEHFERMVPAFANSGVDRRHSVAPLEWFREPRTWVERNDAYLKGATALFEDAARAALADARLEPDEVDTVVTVSSTGVATPTLEARAARALGLRPDIHRVPLFGLGCAGGVTGLSVARTLAAARPGTNVLVVAVECCTLSFRADRLQKADIIATVLFGDGAGAALLSTRAPTGDRPCVSFEPGQEHTWPDTLPIMGWDVDDNGLGVVFDRAIPAFVGERFREAADLCLARAGLMTGDVDRPVCHPGGTKVLEALETCLELAPGALDHERAVLAEAGNMSAPTVLFVLERALDAGLAGQTALCALGPGFTASFLPATIVPARQTVDRETTVGA